MSAAILRPNSGHSEYYPNYSSAVARRHQMQLYHQQQQQQHQQHQQHQQQQQNQHQHQHQPQQHQLNYLQSNCKTESLPEQQNIEQQQQNPILKNNNNMTQNNTAGTPHFEYVSYDRVQDLYEQRKGHFYFIPEGFEPVLVPNDSKAQTVTNLLETSKPVSTVPNVSRMLPDTDVRLPSFALPCGVAGPTKKEVTPNGKTPKVKKPPRPPNAFILYRRAKQPTIVAQHQGITNNEVSKEIGRMWHEEPMEVRLKFQKMAEAAKEEHMKKYPEYRYRPRRPQERKRRVQSRDASNNNRRSSAPVLHRMTSSVAENSDYIPRRISSISTEGDDRNPSVPNHPNQQIYYTNSEVQSPETYLPDGSSMPPQFNSYMQQPMNDFAVFEAQPSNMSDEGVEYPEYDEYNEYNQHMSTLNYGMNSAEHYPHPYNKY